MGRALIAAFSSNEYNVTFQYSTRGQLATDLERKYGVRAIHLELEKLIIPDLKEFDILINNAAVNDSREITHETPQDVWERTLNINLTAPFLLTRAILPHMIERKWGRIINISSIYGLRGCERNLPYTVSKHGLSGLTKTVAKEYASLGITCNEICPGPIESELLGRIASYYKQEPADFDAELASEIPAQRLATPEDIAATAIFLASPAASYVNGVSIPVDGGWIA